MNTVTTIKYLRWIDEIISDNKTNANDYKMLLRYLYNRNFTFLIDMDENRATDGEDFRYRFGLENGYSRSEIEKGLGIGKKPCSILEMMVALANRCEESIMNDPDIGDRTGAWFWGMIKSLGLYYMTDAKFNIDKAEFAVNRFLNRGYEPDGKGGLFTIPNCRKDLRGVEIWYQMCWYLDTLV